MNTSHYDGVGTLPGGEYEGLDIDGVYTCDGDFKAQDINLDGVVTCKGSMEAVHFECDGVVEVGGSIKAGTLDIDGVVSVKQKVEATEIICDGVLNAKKEVSADTIKADGYINAAEIVGDRVTIHSRVRALFFVDLTRRWGKWSTIDFIEATNIELRGVKATTVSGEHIVIGPKCQIENLDCTGTLFIDKSSTVEKITGDYTLTTN